MAAKKKMDDSASALPTTPVICKWNSRHFKCKMLKPYRCRPDILSFNVHIWWAKCKVFFFSVNSECRLNINIMRVIMRGSAKSTLPRSSKIQGIPSWLSYHFEKHKLGRGCSYFLSSFVKFHSMVAVKKLKMSIRGHLGFSIVLKNTNLLEGVEFLLHVLSNSVQRFQRKSRKCEKLTTDRQWTMDNAWSQKCTRAFSSGELKTN